MFYNKEEELAELQKQFQKKENFFLVAFSEEQQAFVGCMGILIRKDEAKTKRWEPLVKEQASFETVARKLLEEGLTLLKRRGVKRLEISFKYMLDELSSVAPLLELFNSVGFNEKVPPTKQFYKQLTEQSSEEIDSIEGNVITFKTRSHYSLETFCDLTVQAFSIIEEDKRIHSWDPIVSNYEHCLELNKCIVAGMFGYSPPEFWLVAQIEQEPAGILVAFSPKREDGLQVGVIGVLGVHPNFRGRGVAKALITTIEKTFLQMGFDYSFVGTPETNKNGVALYEHLNYIPFQRLIFLQKNLE